MIENNLKQKTKSSLYWSLFNQFANQGMQFAIGIVLARLLSPDDYGVTALPIVFISIATLFVDCGFGNALVRKEKLREEDLSTAFYYSLIVGVVCYSALYFSSPWIAEFYNVAILENVMHVTALTFLLSPLSTPQTVILQRKLDFKTPTKIAIAVKFISGVIGIIMAFSGYGVWALVWSQVISNFLSVLLNWWVVRWVPRTGWSKESFRYLWGYGNKLMLSGLLDKIYQNIAPIFIGKYFSVGDLGYFNRADGYAKLPSHNITSSIRGVTFPVLSKLQHDDEALRQKYRKMIRVSAFVIFPIMFMLSALARPLIYVTITDKWEPCVLLLQLLCFSSMWYPIHALNLNLLQVKGRSDLFLRLEFIKKIISLGMMAISLPFGLIVFCAMTVLTSLFSLVVNTYYTGKLIDVGFFLQMKDLFPTIMLSCFMFIVVQAFLLFVSNIYIQCICGGIIGLGIFIGGSILFKFPELEDVKFMLSRK